MEHKTLGDRLGTPEAKALTVTIAATLTKVEAETIADTIGDAAEETDVHTLAIRLPEVVGKTAAIH